MRHVNYYLFHRRACRPAKPTTTIRIQTMKKSLVTIAVLTAMSFGANATFIPAAAVGLNGGGNVQTAIDQLGGQVGALGSDVLKSSQDISAIQARNVQQDKDIHDTYVLANTKYTEAAGKALEGEVRNNKADQVKRDAGQDAVINTKVSQNDFAADQARQDKALSDTKASQAGTDRNQDLAIDKNRTDIKRVDSDIASNVAKQAETDAGQNAVIDTKVSHDDFAADQDRQDKAFADAKTAQAGTDRNQDLAIDKNRTDIKRVDSDIASNVKKQAVTDAGQDRRIDNNDAKIGVVQGEVQQNRGDILTNKNAITKETADRTRADAGLSARIDTKVDGGVYQQRNAVVDQRFVDTDSRIAQNKADQQKVNKVMSDRIDNHEGRIQGLEQSTNSRFADIDKRIDDNRKKANAGTSTALAAAGIPQVLESQDFALGAAVGGYESEQAVAVGFSARVSQSVVVKAAVGTDTQHGVGYNAGVSIGW